MDTDQDQPQAEPFSSEMEAARCLDAVEEFMALVRAGEVPEWKIREFNRMVRQILAEAKAKREAARAHAALN